MSEESPLAAWLRNGFKSAPRDESRETGTYRYGYEDGCLVEIAELDDGSYYIDVVWEPGEGQ